MKLGRKILNLRLDRGLDQDELAALCGVTPSALSLLERGHRAVPKATTLFRLSQALGVTCDYLLDEEQPYPYEPPPRPELKDHRKVVTASCTREEAAHLDALRAAPPLAREVARELPYLTQEQLAIARVLLYRRPGKAVRKALERLLRNGSGA